MSNLHDSGVQWFPGHMAKTRRLIKETVSNVDAVCELTDARVPLSSRNPEIPELIGAKPRIILLNKCDLADDKATAAWIKEYKNKGLYALPVDCRTGKGVNLFLPAVRKLLKAKIESNRAKGMANKPLRVMVVGIPNTGKSSFINRMGGKSRAAVADKPGVTRTGAWFPVGSGVELYDTPGVLWPKFEDPAVGDKLAFIGSVKDTVIDTQSLAVRLLQLLGRDYPQLITNRYGISGFENEDGFDILQRIGKKRGMLISGGEVDTERAANILLDEFRAGRLGRVTLELPE